MNRTQWTLGGLLVLQVGWIALARGPIGRGDTAAVAARPLLPEVAGLQAQKIAVDGKDGAKLTLVRSGETWGIEEAGGYPAEMDKVTKLVESLKGLQVRRPVVSSSRYHAALKVTEKENERRLRMWDDPTGAPKVDVLFGSSPNYRITHVRRAAEEPVYEVSGVGVYDIRDSAAGWIDTRFVDAESARVTRFKLQNSHGTFELENSGGSWQVASPGGPGTKLDATKVDALVRAATLINTAEPAGKIDRAAHGLEPPQATVTLQIAAAPADAAVGEGDEAATPAAPPRDITLWVGGSVPGVEGQQFLARAGFDYTVRVWKGSVEKFIDGKLKDLK